MAKSKKDLVPGDFVTVYDPLREVYRSGYVEALLSKMFTYKPVGSALVHFAYYSDDWAYADEDALGNG
jgi:hypothetical protein